MSRLKSSPIIERNIQDRSYDLLGAMILEKEAVELLQEIENDHDTESAAAMEAYFEERDDLYLSLIAKKLRRSRTKHALSSITMQVLKIASVFALVIVMGGSIALAASEQLRIEVMRLLIKYTDEYTILELSPSDGELNAPLQWKGKYFLSGVPHDLEMAQCTSTTVQFVSKTNTGQYVQFGEYDISASVNIDTEDGAFKQTMIMGEPAQIATKGELVHVYWIMDDRLFTITARGYNEEQVIRLANSLKVKENN